MKIELNYYQEGYQKEKFEVEQGSPSKDFLLLIFKGSFWLYLPETGEESLIEAGEGVFIPAGMRFERRILSPIDFHQFSIVANAENDFYRAMHAGKLRLPSSHLGALMESLHRANRLEAGWETVTRLAEHLITEEFLYGAELGERDEITRDIRDTVEYMSAHLREKLDIKTLASRVYLSHTGLIWKFRRQLGMTPLQYLITLRMRLAQQLLLEGDLPICEIAETCGYPSAYYFTNAFRKHTGKSPSAFRGKSKERKK